MSYESRLENYDDLVKESGYIRKGKTMPYTSHNGHMFSLFNKAGEIGFRYSKEVQKSYFEKYKTTFFISYGAKMKGYILITDEMLEDKNTVYQLLKESYEYICSLEPK